MGTMVGAVQDVRAFRARRRLKAERMARASLRERVRPLSERVSHPTTVAAAAGYSVMLLGCQLVELALTASLVSGAGAAASSTVAVVMLCGAGWLVRKMYQNRLRAHVLILLMPLIVGPLAVALSLACLSTLCYFNFMPSSECSAVDTSDNGGVQSSAYDIAADILRRSLAFLTGSLFVSVPMLGSVCLEALCAVAYCAWVCATSQRTGVLGGAHTTNPLLQSAVAIELPATSGRCAQGGSPAGEAPAKQSRSRARKMDMHVSDRELNDTIQRFSDLLAKRESAMKHSGIKPQSPKRAAAERLNKLVMEGLIQLRQARQEDAAERSKERELGLQSLRPEDGECGDDGDDGEMDLLHSAEETLLSRAQRALDKSGPAAARHSADTHGHRGVPTHVETGWQDAAGWSVKPGWFRGADPAGEAPAHPGLGGVQPMAHRSSVSHRQLGRAGRTRSSRVAQSQRSLAKRRSSGAAQPAMMRRQSSQRPQLSKRFLGGGRDKAVKAEPTPAATRRAEAAVLTIRSRQSLIAIGQAAILAQPRRSTLSGAAAPLVADDDSGGSDDESRQGLELDDCGEGEDDIDEASGEEADATADEDSDRLESQQRPSQSGADDGRQPSTLREACTDEVATDEADVSGRRLAADRVTDELFSSPRLARVWLPESLVPPMAPSASAQWAQRAWSRMPVPESASESGSRRNRNSVVSAEALRAIQQASSALAARRANPVAALAPGLRARPALSSGFGSSSRHLHLPGLPSGPRAGSHRAIGRQPSQGPAPRAALGQARRAPEG